MYFSFNILNQIQNFKNLKSQNTKNDQIWTKLNQILGPNLVVFCSLKFRTVSNS